MMASTDTMTSFFQAFSDRYMDSGDIDVEELTIKGNKQKYIKDLVVELVGREKAVDTFKNLKNLRQIVLSDCSIQCLCQIDTIKDERVACELLKSNLRTNKSIKSLDISYNQISSWYEIVRIVELFPSLEELILSGNPFETINLNNLLWQQEVLGKISNLVAGKLKINWSSIESFNSIFVNLRSLNIFNNHLTDILFENSSSFVGIEYLSLSENRIGWQNVLNLKQLRNLKHLQLDNCGIETLKLNEPDLFKNLNQLNLNNNLISKWSDISELMQLTNLSDLCIRENPIFTANQDYDMIFNFIVAILKTLKVLNKQMITVDKRKESEIYFLRTNYRAWSTGQLSEWNVEERFNELIDFYGRPVDLLKDVQVNKFIVVHLTDQQKTFKKKLLKSMDVSTLRMLIQRLFSLPNQTDFDLWYLNENNKTLEFKFDQDNRNLEFYPINENCTIQIKTKD